MRLEYGQQGRKRKHKEREKRLKSATVVCLPGFMRHLVECGYLSPDGEGFFPVTARYGMARQQELSSGVVWALSGTRGSGDVKQ